MKKKSQMYAAVTAILGWFAVIGQLCLALQNRQGTTMEILIEFFCFFTVLTNIIVATRFTYVFLKRPNSFWIRPGVQTAITMYIVAVGIVYNLMLRFLWNPQGLQRVVDELLHTIIPILSIVYWLAFVPKTSLKWKDSIAWMLYPVVYTICIVIRGAVSGQYPYPFIDVAAIGYPQALLNGGVLLMAFMGLSLFLIAVAKWLSRKQTISL